MNIDLIANDGSPIGVIPPDVFGKGVGGAELAMVNLMATFAARGHKVTVFNDPVKEAKFDDGVTYRSRRHFNARAQGKRDVLIVFRSPNPLLVGAKVNLRKVWWSTDQHTVGNFKVLSQAVDFCVTISPYHTKYHLEKYGIDPKKIGHIDLGVRLNDYSDRVLWIDRGKKDDDGKPIDYKIEASQVSKIKNRMIFCSVPDRGLSILHAAWPLILAQVPDATLSITSDYRLWGAKANNAQHRLNWAGMKGVTFYGKVYRDELIKFQLESEIMPYPCIYEELFCISAAECQVAGAFPVTTPIGALSSTNEFGIKAMGDLRNPTALRENFVDRICSLATKERDYLEDRIDGMMLAARLRFDWDKIAEKWEYLFEEGRLPI
jgi:glycosyltransferase involved in cell wall biosynthesis